MTLKKAIKAIIPMAKFIYYDIIIKIKKKCDSEIWLISERGDEARDNGYFLYKYLKENRKDINLKYVITKDSSDYSKIDKKDVIIYGSKEHYIKTLTAKYLISTHILGFAPNTMAYSFLRKAHIIKNNGKIISLKHGITKDYIPMLDKKNKYFDLIISAAEPEYYYMKKTYNYDDNQIKYTGFARFDTLISNIQNNQILIMPTWRRYISFIKNDEEFMKTYFYRQYSNILNNEKLLEFIEEENIKIIFYLHHEMQKFIHLFRSKSKKVIIASPEQYDVQKLLIESSILITDYSSVFFDFAYMKKPEIYFQFDYKEYRKNHYNEGYFVYTKNGFGPVVDKIEDLLSKLIEYVKNDYIIEEKYQNRISNFFTRIDNKNCERIVYEIENL